MQRVVDRIPPVKPGEADEASIPADQSALRSRGGGCEEGIVDVIAPQSEILTPTQPLFANPLGPGRFAEKATVLNSPEELGGLFYGGRGAEDVRMGDDPQESHFY